MGVQDDLQMAVLVAVQRDGVINTMAILLAWPGLDKHDLNVAIEQLVRDGAITVDPSSTRRGLPMRLTPLGEARLAGPELDDAWLRPAPGPTAYTPGSVTRE